MMAMMITPKELLAPTHEHWRRHCQKPYFDTSMNQGMVYDHNRHNKKDIALKDSLPL